MAIFSSIFPHAEYQIHRNRVTTGSVKTTIHTVSLAEECTAFLRVYGTVRKSDGSEQGVFETRAAFFRNTSGNVTILNSQHDIFTTYTAGCACDVGMEADTTNQTVLITITGEASTSYLWDCKIGYMIVNY